MGTPQIFVTFKLSDGSLSNVNICDTAGQEKFKSLVEGFYRGANCCLLVYDITKKESFNEIKNYYSKMVKEKCGEEIKTMLLGNKTDLENERQVSTQEGIDLSLQNGYFFNETSCLKNLNVADAFQTLIEMTHREAQQAPKVEKVDDSNNIKINNISVNVNASDNSRCVC